MARFKIITVSYYGDNYSYESPVLKNGVNILEGDNGTGKTTFSDLIYYCLGGTVKKFNKDDREKHVEVTGDTNNHVELQVQINGLDYKLIRILGKNDISIIDSNEDVKLLPVFRGENSKYTFSDWMLSKLGIDVFDLYLGNKYWKINLTDLFRLIYYDQSEAARKIFKQADNNSFVSDSEIARKAIFEVLVGKNFAEYYSNQGKLKIAEQEKVEAKSKLDGYVKMINSVNTLSEGMNLPFLDRIIKNKLKSLDKLEKSRFSIQYERPQITDNVDKIEEWKLKILDRELSYEKLQGRSFELIDESQKLKRLRENMIEDSKHIEKIIFSHEKLNLFSDNTCPTCLRDVPREKGHCICGSTIDEAQYEKFFYSKDEYLDMIKSKKKSIETVDAALMECNKERAEVESSLKALSSEIEKLKIDFKATIEHIEDRTGTDELREIENQILKVSRELSDYQKLKEMMVELDSIQKEYDSKLEAYNELRAKDKILDGQSVSDIQNMVKTFNGIYDDLMRDIIVNCNSAKIDDESYMPIINNGDYIEASSVVPLRFMYYLTLLAIALRKDEVKHPKFMLVDTPETMGIDEHQLEASIAKINDIIPEDKSEDDFQVILTTGIDKYPEIYADKVFAKLTKENRLLIPN